MSELRLTRIGARIGLVAAIAVGAACPAFAVDGVRELSQACVATGCVPDDDPGFPIELQNDGNYRLTSSILVPDANTSAIVVGSDFVTIDLNGFMITGVTYCTGTPVTSCAPTGSGGGITSSGGRLTVRDGIVRGFGSAGIQSGNATVLEDVRIEENGGDGITANASAQDWVVRGCMIRRNGGNGIATSGTSAGMLITGNSIAGNKQAGLLATRGTVSDNVVTSNGGFGLQTGTGAGLVGNTFSGNNGGGTQLSGGLQIGQNQCGTVACP